MVFSRKPDPRSLEVVTPEYMPERPFGASITAKPVASNGLAGLTESVIGNDLTIEGQTITIRCKGSLRVNGNIQADLHSKELIVGNEAVITGSIAAETVRVMGRVNGAIYGTNVVLHATAAVEGDIHSKSLGVEQGASFDGRSRKVNDVSEIAPQLESSSMSSILHS